MLWYYIGECLVHEKNYSSGRRAFEKAIMLDPKHLPSIIGNKYLFYERK